MEGTIVADIELTEEQQAVHDAVLAFVKRGDTELKVGGYAGTGKTTLVAQIVRTLRKKNKKIRIAFCCFTGKAASVLRDKLAAVHVLQEGDTVGTIHSLIYEPVIERHIVVDWQLKPAVESDLIVVDEASMVSGAIWADLKSYSIPILAVGDHGQLPPIGGSINLMEKPDYTLTTIHRQALGNPIIGLSIRARLDGKIQVGEYTGTSEGYAKKIVEEVEVVVSKTEDLSNTMFLCGYNITRKFVNALVRHKLGFMDKTPMVDETVICLKNNRAAGIFNGMSGQIVAIKPVSDLFYEAEIRMDDGTLYNGNIIKQQFGAPKTLTEVKGLPPNAVRDLFDWGYCLTVWKAQGSEADNVVFFEERFSSMTDDDYRRYLYTGITRARKNLLIVQKK